MADAPRLEFPEDLLTDSDVSEEDTAETQSEEPPRSTKLREPKDTDELVKLLKDDLRKLFGR